MHRDLIELERALQLSGTDVASNKDKLAMLVKENKPDQEQQFHQRG
jgi:hypothetical protein